MHAPASTYRLFTSFIHTAHRKTDCYQLTVALSNFLEDYKVFQLVFGYPAALGLCTDSLSAAAQKPTSPLQRRGRVEGLERVWCIQGK